jgi:transcriptional regulator with XRE-family HTH domain
MGEVMDRTAYEAAGAWLDDQRMRAGLRVDVLARRAEVSQVWLYTIRHGGRTEGETWRLPNPHPERLAKLAEALGIDVDEVFTRFGVSVAAPAPRRSAIPELDEVRAELAAQRRRLDEQEVEIARLRHQLADERSGRTKRA